MTMYYIQVYTNHEWINLSTRLLRVKLGQVERTGPLSKEDAEAVIAIMSEQDKSYKYRLVAEADMNDNGYAEDWPPIPKKRR